ncbi:hypothetical protein GSI_08810 [Ganoderma sinense ZZ0214-1]|uniref:Uncharacterized protein n=1 Tax=Ganoderma sinense ZZ0214-1 TaxID=1077348 RepID=A0A2G8S4R4_9APHY|nr:hypothetical protein GSI_08810 [Ganoderma sinense ZZ0214-1]
MPPLPLGVKVVTELEGVDGKSGKPGSGRSGPIDVSDAYFTTEHLRKASSIFVPDRDLREASSSSSSDIIPRGGHCASCNDYILWGDLVRGCYRRREGGVTPEVEQDDGDEQDEDEDLGGQLFSDQREDEDDVVPPKASRSITSRRTIKQSKARGAGPSASKPAPFSTLAPPSSSDEREHFDLDNISGGSSDEQESDDGRPHPPGQDREECLPGLHRYTRVLGFAIAKIIAPHRHPLTPLRTTGRRRPRQQSAPRGQGLVSRQQLSSGFSPPGSAHSVAGKCVTEEYPEGRRARRQGNHARPTWQERTLSIVFFPRQGMLRAAPLTGDPLVRRREPSLGTVAGRWRSRVQRWANQVCGLFPTCHRFHSHGQRWMTGEQGSRPSIMKWWKSHLIDEDGPLVSGCERRLGGWHLQLRTEAADPKTTNRNRTLVSGGGTGVQANLIHFESFYPTIGKPLHGHSSGKSCSPDVSLGH